MHVPSIFFFGRISYFDSHLYEPPFEDVDIYEIVVLLGVSSEHEDSVLESHDEYL